ncbi:hypothetical protein MK079_05265, partial [Candidatus Gracilibacteria bacterium]|nr:hypothetical protein [Candidatus Gracilibacteria bacterium]
MQKGNHKFIIFVLVCVGALFGISTYHASQVTQENKSFVTLVQGNGMVNKKILKVDIPKNILAGDTIKTI